jgi:hypothetical protein
MLGDYQGIAESTNASVPAVPVWIDTRIGNPDPFVARVEISPTAIPTPTPTPIPIPNVSVAVSPVTINEGADVTYTISASTINPSQATTVRYTMAGKAQFGTDYTLSGVFGQADIPAGASSTTVVLHALTDTVNEGNERAKMRLSAATNYRISRPKRAIATIANAP